MPSVTPLSVGLLTAARAVVSVLMMVPPRIVPLMAPPARVATSSVLPVLVSVPCSVSAPPVLLMSPSEVYE